MRSYYSMNISHLVSSIIIIILTAENRKSQKYVDFEVWCEQFNVNMHASVERKTSYTNSYICQILFGHFTQASNEVYFLNLSKIIYI